MGIAKWPPTGRCLVPGTDGLFLVPDGIVREGSQGIVFKAEEDGETLAVKFLKEWTGEGDPTVLFRQEARVGIQHGSPTLGRSFGVIDLRRFRGWPPLAIKMEYFPLSLERLLEDCRENKFHLPLYLMERWTRNLAEACRDLHAEAYIHRDVKPGNIMFRWPRGKTYGRAESLKHATAVLMDLGAIARKGQVAHAEVFHDDWKDPLYFRAHDQAPRPPLLLEPAADIFSLGKVFDALVPYIDGPAQWLERAARKCQDDPGSRLTAEHLLPQLSAKADERIRLAERAGWRLGQHAQFVGREWASKERDRFIEQCAEDGHGGIFVVVGPAGVGKSALLTNWAATGAPWPGYYFNFRETGRTDSMPENIHRQIQHELSADYRPPTGPWETKDFQALLDDWSRNNPRGRLLIFIDALDEAKSPRDRDDLPKEHWEGPGLAAELIPKDPPRGVFLIVSSRPAATRSDHLGKLRCDHLWTMPLLPEDERNKDDMTRYFRTRLEDYLDGAGQAERLTAAAGVFRLAVLLAQDVRSGKETVPDLLERAATSWGKLPAGEKLFGYYQDDLQRVLDEDLEPYFNDFARLVVALQDRISEDEILLILQHAPPANLSWHEGRRDRLIRSLGWFLKSESRQRDGEQTEICYWPQHESVRDFLVADTPQFRGHARKGVAEMHSRIGNCFRQLAQQSGWNEVPYYGRLHAARHLLKSRKAEDGRTAAQELLCNPVYLQGTLGDEPLEGEA